MASGLDTESIISAADGDRADQGHRRAEAAGLRQSAQDGPADDQDEARRGQDRGRPTCRPPSLWKPKQTTTLLGPDEGRRHRARRRRHRRPVDPGRPPRVLGAARLQLHGRRRRRGQDRLHAAAARPSRSTSRPTRPRPTSPPPINGNDSAPVYAAVVKDGGVEKLVFSSRKTGQNSDFTVDTSQLGAGTVLDRGHRLHAHGRDAQRRRSRSTAARSTNPESNVLENIIPGVRVTLKGVTTSPASVSTTSPAVDQDAITKKITALVDAYNAVVTVHALGADREEGPDARRPARTCRRASCSATPA